MVLPRRLGTFNRAVTNRIAGPVAPHLPGFGVIVHRGRKSGRSYRTPVTVFAAPDGYLVALTYGVDADWVRNVRAAGDCELETRGRREHCGPPSVIHDPSRRGVPCTVRVMLRLVGVSDFLVLPRQATR